MGRGDWRRENMSRPPSRVSGVGTLIIRTVLIKTICYRDFPGGPVVKTPSFHCRGHRFDPWPGN